MEKKTEGLRKRNAQKRDSWKRQLDQEERGRCLSRCATNYVANPKNFKRKNRSESPPPKKKRTRAGINRGHAAACSHCRPEICNRMAATADLRERIRFLKKENYESELSPEEHDYNFVYDQLST